MKHLKNLLIPIMLLIANVANSNAQGIELGASNNYMTSGIYLSNYRPVANKWGLKLGVRTIINTFSINENKQSAVLYRNGFATKWWEFLGLTAAIQYRIIKIRNFSVNGEISTFFNWHGIKRHSRGMDIFTGNMVYHVLYTKPSFVVEMTIGLNLEYTLSSRLSINAGSGVGILYSHHSFYSKSLLTGNTIRTIHLDVPSSRERGIHEFTGFDGLPMLSVGARYKLW